MAICRHECDIWLWYVQWIWTYIKIQYFKITLELRLGAFPRSAMSHMAMQCHSAPGDDWLSYCLECFSGLGLLGQPTGPQGRTSAKIGHFRKPRVRTVGCSCCSGHVLHQRGLRVWPPLWHCRTAPNPKGPGSWHRYAWMNLWSAGNRAGPGWDSGRAKIKTVWNPRTACRPGKC